MIDNSDRINDLLSRLEILLKKQESFSREINDLRIEIERLKVKEVEAIISENIEVHKEEPKVEIKNVTSEVVPEKKPEPVLTSQELEEPSEFRNDIEKFIGENLINKIGIVITVIGVAIGAKYSIEHHLISPLARIILGYLIGLTLFGFAVKLKAKYHNYSAVLVSGAMAIMYFITYFAYNFYSLMPQWLAFALMVIVTAVTVYEALNYNRQVIAHIGLVGAYTVPFLLSNESGNVVILFSYTAIINIGILIIALKKYWKPIYYSSLLLTWLIFFSWYISKYQVGQHFELALVFLSIFFIIFYTIFLAYKLLNNEKFEVHDIILLILNSFIFYSIGYSILDGNESTKNILGLYTLCNAIVHSLVGLVIYLRRESDKNLFFFVSGLALVFLTIAIPVQLNGNWVTLLWIGEAALLFWVGRTKGVSAYEILSYPLMGLAFISLLQDWAKVYMNFIPGRALETFTPIFNINFLSSLLFVAALWFITFISRNKKYTSWLSEKNEDLLNILSFCIPSILIFVIYVSFRNELAHYWNQLYAGSLRTVSIEGQEPIEYYDKDLQRYKVIWSINYSLLFFSILSLVNIRKIKNQLLGFINLGINTLVVIVFLTQGLYILSELRENYLSNTLSNIYPRSGFSIGIRYITLVFAGFFLYVFYKYIKQEFIKFNFRMVFDILLFITIVWVASSEMISWMDIAGSSQSYKLGLSILWGVYSFLLISLGIWKQKKYLRISAIALFAITLIKLFFYDLTRLNTISKTVVFIVLGVLLLIISFLYNKYKYKITSEDSLF